MIDLAQRRQFYAEEVQAVCNLQSPALIEAFATVPREEFLPPGPWFVFGFADGDLTRPPRPTPDTDPRHVYHNYSIAIDQARQLYNGQPATVGAWIDTLRLSAGARVLHVGCGLGYYTALMAHCVGPSGRVVAFDVDESLAARARLSLAAMPWVDVRAGNGLDIAGETFDAILINAGVTHPADAWLDSLAPHARMVLPLTAMLPTPGATSASGASPAAASPPSTIGKGIVVTLTKREDVEIDARTLTFVAIYSAIGIRDERLNEPLGKALMRGTWGAIRRLRREVHEPDATCWLHADRCCVSMMERG
jgi:protein-L-isoaspartate(D-aspartate) O-methyltransferase